MTRLEEVGEGLWVAEGGIVSFFGFPYPTRSVVVRLDAGRLWVWSPIRLDEDLRREIDGLGDVAHLVSPNKLHHLFLEAWKSAYPAARLWAPRSTIARFRKLEFAGVLADSPPPEWGPDIDQAWFRGSLAMDEIVFFHRPSRTAIVADLIEAFDDDFLQRHWPWWSRPLARLDGIAAAHPGAPREWRLSFFDRAPARAAREKALGWGCERVVIAHGRWPRSASSISSRPAPRWETRWSPTSRTTCAPSSSSAKAASSGLCRPARACGATPGSTRTR